MSRANDERSPVAGATSQEQTKTDDAILREKAAERKATARRAALAALAGIEARKLADGGWLVSRWGQYRELDDDHAFDAWLERFGGRT